MANKDWYWPVGIAATLFLFVAFLIGTLLFSRTIPVNLVSEDYYENSLNYQQQLERIRRTQEIGGAVFWQFQPEKKAAVLTIPTAATSPDVHGSIEFIRPSDARKDRTVPLQLDANGHQELSLNGMEKGLWRVRILWGENGADFYEERILVIP